MSLQLSLERLTGPGGRPRGRLNPGWALLPFALFLFALLHNWHNHTEALAHWRERLATGRTPRLPDVIEVSLWIATSLNLALCTLLTASRRLWIGPRDSRPEPRPAPFTLSLWIGLAIAVALGAALRAPRLGLSLYSDEEYSLRTYISGRWVTPDSEHHTPTRFQAVPWNATLWGNREGNNHVLASVSSRLSLELWRRFTGHGPDAFSEIALRLPAFLAGCLGIAMLALALTSLGMPRAGVVAAFLAAIHPWHLRYSTEARGYGFVLFFAPLLVALACGILRDGRWRWWLGFALAEVGLLASFPGAMDLAFALSFALLVGTVFGGIGNLPFRDGLARFIVAHLLAAMLFLQLMAPSIPQIYAFLHDERMRGWINWEWIRGVWTHLAIGINWLAVPPESKLILTLPHNTWPGSQVAVALAAGIIPILALAGFIRMMLQGRTQALVALALAGCAPFAVAHHAIAGTNVLVWYMIFALPGLIILVAAGIAPPSNRRERTRFSREEPSHSPANALAVLFLSLFLIGTHRQTWILMTHSKEDLKGVASLVHGDPGEGAIGIVFWTNAPVYDPDLHVVWSAPDLWQWMERASTEGRPLRIGYAHRIMAAQSDETRALLALAEDPRYFEPEKELPGLEEDQFTHWVRSLRPDQPPR